MTEDRALRLVPQGDVDTDTGELVQDDKDILKEELTNKLSGALLEIGRLKREMRDLRAVEPKAEEIRDVLKHAREVWGCRWQIIPGGKRWNKVRQRLQDKLEDRDPWTVEELKRVADQARMDPWLNGTDERSPGYLKVETVYRDPEQVERLLEEAAGFEVKTGFAPGEIPPELFREDLRDLCRRCDCGHLRFVHALPDGAGLEGCRRCSCVTFDDINVRAEAWIQEEGSRGG